MTPEQRRAKREAAKAAAARRARERWYIQISVRPHPTFITRWGGVGYQKLVWPILFRSEALAWQHIHDCGDRIFSNADLLGARKIVSCSVQKTMVPA